MEIASQRRNTGMQRRNKQETTCPEKRLYHKNGLTQAIGCTCRLYIPVCMLDDVSRVPAYQVTRYST